MRHGEGEVGPEGNDVPRGGVGIDERWELSQLIEGVKSRSNRDRMYLALHRTLPGYRINYNPAQELKKKPVSDRLACISLPTSQT